MTARAWPRDGSLLREAQAAILAAFDNANTITAAQLRVATAGFSKKTANRGRAELTRAGVLVRSRRGMEGEVTYTIDQRHLTSLAAQYRSRRFSKTDQQRQRMANNAAACSTQEHDAPTTTSTMRSTTRAPAPSAGLGIGSSRLLSAFAALAPLVLCAADLARSRSENPNRSLARSISLPRVTLNANRDLEAGRLRRLQRRSPAVRPVFVTCDMSLKGTLSLCYRGKRCHRIALSSLCGICSKGTLCLCHKLPCSEIGPTLGPRP